MHDGGHGEPAFQQLHPVSGRLGQAGADLLLEMGAEHGLRTSEGSSGLLVMRRADRGCPAATWFGTRIAHETRAHHATNGSMSCDIHVATRA